jgi:hypothetical protein
MASPLNIKRMERKYKVEQEDVSAFLDALSAKMKVSEYIPGRPVVQIATVYLDTPDYHFAKKALNSHSMSIKLRAKDYSYRVQGAVETSNFCWVEIKSRNGISTEKWRFPLSKRMFGGLYRGQDVSEAVVSSARKSSYSKQAVGNYKRFQSHIRERKIAPSTIVTYSRLVFELDDWDLRLTVDSNVRYYKAPENPYSYLKTIVPEKLGQPIGAEDDVIVETKSANGVPGWLWPLLKACRSTQEFSKFATSSKKRMLLE